MPFCFGLSVIKHLSLLPTTVLETFPSAWENHGKRLTAKTSVGSRSYRWLGLPRTRKPCYVYGYINSFVPGRCGTNFKSLIVRLIIQNGSWGTRWEIALRWMPQNFTDEKSTLVQVMAWCRQVTSHYLIQCWQQAITWSNVDSDLCRHMVKRPFDIIPVGGSLCRLRKSLSDIGLISSAYSVPCNK